MSTKEQLEATIKELQERIDREVDKPLRKVFFSKHSGVYVLIYTLVVGLIGFLMGKGV